MHFFNFVGLKGIHKLHQNTSNYSKLKTSLSVVVILSIVFACIYLCVAYLAIINFDIVQCSTKMLFFSSKNLEYCMISFHVARYRNNHTKIKCVSMKWYLLCSEYRATKTPHNARSWLNNIWKASIFVFNSVNCGIESSQQLAHITLELIEMRSGARKFDVNFPVKSFWWLFIRAHCMHNK